MLNEVIENTERFIASVPKAKRKKYGQFFTNSTTAKFMAFFCFDLSKSKIEILDAGAGTGILAAAVVQKLQEDCFMRKIESMTEKVTAGNSYVTAFLDFSTFKNFSEQLAWETEVWIADMPDHMIHLNGDKFLGPR